MSNSSARKRLVAIIDDDPVARRVMHVALASAGYSTVEFASGEAAMQARIDGWSGVCLDLGLDDVPGMRVLERLRARDAELPVVVVTAERRVDTAVQAMRAGAYDYVMKPIDAERLLATMRRAIERRDLVLRVGRLKRALDTRRGLGVMIGESAPMRELLRQVERVLATDVGVCVFGESGTGKELVARAIHENGPRKNGPLVAINCAAVPTQIQESELFGHEKGSFTGAEATHKGRFEQANGGTLFLDELGEMSAATQASLLRALQEKRITRVGGSAEIPVDVRIVAATHRDLEAEVRAGRFREDLYFRLVVYPIRIPPLRERSEDVPLLAEHFLTKLSEGKNSAPPRLPPEVIEALVRYRWPGNVRELENVIHRALISCEGDEIRLADLAPSVREASAQRAPAKPEATMEDLVGGARVPTLKELEQRAIDRALQLAGGSITKAAKMLGIGRATLYRRLSEDGRDLSALAS